MAKFPTTRVLLLAVFLCGDFAVSTSLTCPSPYENINGFCLYLAFHSSDKKQFCQAQETCNSIGGRLVTGFNKVMALKQHMTAINMNTQVMLGATDLLHETTDTKTGWLFSDGTQLPYVTGEWSNIGINKDPTDDILMLYTVSGNILLEDRRTPYAERFACEPWPKNIPSTFIPMEFPRHHTGSIYYCSEPEFQVAEFTECAFMCSQRPECAVFLYKEPLKKCKLILHTDASVEDVFEDDPDWKKYKRVW